MKVTGATAAANIAGYSENVTLNTNGGKGSSRDYISEKVTLNVDSNGASTINNNDTNIFNDGEIISENNNITTNNNTTSADYVIIAELGTVSVDTSGLYTFSVTLSDDATPGAKLLWLAGSSEPSEDDNIAEFYGTDGADILTVPDNKVITVSAWLNSGKIYTPAVAAKQ